jgi:hypothetical protein
MLAVAAGLIYGLMGLFVGVGVLLPRSGATFLNVADADEIREERRKLGPGAVACILIGLFFLTLVWASDRPSMRLGALLIIAACIIGVAVTSFASRARYDELMRQVSTEASAFTLRLSMVLLGGWATLSHLGYVRWMSPLAFVAGLALLSLVAIFWISAKKGLMTPR